MDCKKLDLLLISAIINLKLMTMKKKQIQFINHLIFPSRYACVRVCVFVSCTVSCRCICIVHPAHHAVSPYVAVVKPHGKGRGIPVTMAMSKLIIARISTWERLIQRKVLIYSYMILIHYLLCSDVWRRWLSNRWLSCIFKSESLWKQMNVAASVPFIFVLTSLANQE